MQELFLFTLSTTPQTITYHLAIEVYLALGGLMKKVLAVLGALATLFVLLLAMGIGKIAGKSAVDGYYGGKKEDALAQVAIDVNKTLPNMVDGDTRLDKTSAGPGMLFTYHHTLINYPAPGQNHFDIFDGVEVFSSNLTNKVCTNAQMRPMMSAGITVVYLYNDKNDVKLFDVTIPPNKCTP